MSSQASSAKEFDVGPFEYYWGDKEIILYNLAVGAKADELPFVYEKSPAFQAVPTFGVIPFFCDDVIFHHANVVPRFNLKQTLLGEHYLEILQHPIPTTGASVSTGKVVELLDKGKAAIATTGYTTYDLKSKSALFYNELTFFLGGAGGFSKEGKPEQLKATFNKPRSMPSREPDQTAELQTSNEQAALYRLTGDRMVLHVDPEFARQAGQPKPILHGAGFMGIAAKHIVDAYGPVRSIRARFVGPVLPGQKLRTSMWRDSAASEVLYQVRIVETGKLCIDNGVVRLWQDNVPLAGRL